MKSNRLSSIDFFRGLTVIIMIIVNSPGNSSPYSWLEHSTWNGCTLADLVFPFFVFILGMSIPFAFARSKHEVGKKQLLFKIMRRSLVLFMAGILLNLLPNHFDLAHLRFPGVLQRLALCYAAAAVLYLYLQEKGLFLAFFILVSGYYFIILIPVPGMAQHLLTTDGNIGAYLDRLLLGSAHLYQQQYDPEGILSTIPSIATALIGVLTAMWLLSATTPRKKMFGLISAGIFLVLSGLLLAIKQPINKTLWTSAYVLYTGGWALLVFSICYWWRELKGNLNEDVFILFGTNALFIYFVHVLGLKLQAVYKINADSKILNLREYITTVLYSGFSQEKAAFLYSITYLAFCFMVLQIRRNVGYPRNILQKEGRHNLSEIGK